MAIWRFQVLPRGDDVDPVGRRLLETLQDFGIHSVRSVQSSRLYFIELPESMRHEGIDKIAKRLLTDPVVEKFQIAREGDALSDPDGALGVEVHFLPGVMDPVAQSTAYALSDMGIAAGGVRTATRYDLHPAPSDADRQRIPRLVGNGSIQEVVLGSKPIGPPPAPPQYEFRLRHIELCALDDKGLERLSREGHLFLTLDEMRTIQRHFIEAGRDPTDLELETLAQTWSEHCVHKTLKSAIDYFGLAMPPQAGQATLRFDSLLKDTIARATRELMAERRGPQCLSVFVDNAGIIGFDDDYGVAFKVETHNHPSAIEPYGGASTGVGGVIRDVLGCGLGARPIANTDVFCVAPPDWPIDGVPRGVIHPRTVLKGVVAGVRDYGNRMGIPTVNGAVHFDPRYLGNPLVYCGCAGLIPRNRIEKAARPGDAIVLLGGRTGRDGIHGATFSSAELTDTHEDEFSHAVQIGNAIEEKKVLDVVLAARDHREAGANGETSCLFSAITDCGAGGLSSAIGEMAASCGAEVDLEKVPLKYAGLRYDEIWISEAQERMVLAVPPENIETLLALARGEDVEATVIGRFNDGGRLVVRYEGQLVGDLSLEFLHDGLPKSRRTARWAAPEKQRVAAIGRPHAGESGGALIEALTARLGDLNVASRHWIIRQYDHEVQGGSIVKPLAGPGDGPSDAAVVRPRLDSVRGVALSCGLSLKWSDVDPYWGAVAAIDEAIRNAVCVGGDPANAAILDNFCWPASDDEHALGALVRACQGCYDAAKAYGTPFISGKDSLNNVFAMSGADRAMVRQIVQQHYPESAAMLGAQEGRLGSKLAIPYTLLISAIALVEDVRRCIRAIPQIAAGEAVIYYIGMAATDWADASMTRLARLHADVAGMIRKGDILAAHDVSDGGLAVAVAEMAFAAGASVDMRQSPGQGLHPLFEGVSGYLLQPRDPDALVALGGDGIIVVPVATMRRDEVPTFRFVNERGDVTGSTALSVLRDAWRHPLDW